MTEVLALLGRALALAFAAGVNLYATVAVVGLAQWSGWVPLPPQFEIFGSPWVVGAAGLLFLVEFVADKVPWLDTVWDGIHTAVRPLGGALLAVTTVGDTHPALQGGVALAGALVAATSHFTKAGTRAMVNASPSSPANWTISLAEDLFVLGLSALALRRPVAALVAWVVLAIAILASARLLVRAIKRRFLRPAGDAPTGPR